MILAVDERIFVEISHDKGPRIENLRDFRWSGGRRLIIRSRKGGGAKKRFFGCLCRINGLGLSSKTNSGFCS
jgi:hypothetical protein